MINNPVQSPWQQNTSTTVIFTSTASLGVLGNAGSMTIMGGSGTAASLVLQSNDGGHPRSAPINVDKLNVLNNNFAYPAGGFRIIHHAPTVSTVNEVAPVMRFINAQPTLSYSTAISMGLGTNYFVNLSPNLTAV